MTYLLFFFLLFLSIKVICKIGRRTKSVTLFPGNVVAKIGKYGKACVSVVYLSSTTEWKKDSRAQKRRLTICTTRSLGTESAMRKRKEHSVLKVPVYNLRHSRTHFVPPCIHGSPKGPVSKFLSLHTYLWPGILTQDHGFYRLGSRAHLPR